MGRPKSYERDALIEQAIAVFREHGFARTSASLLVERLGVNRSGIYAEFGSKQGLFEAALARYFDEALERNFGVLDSPEAGVDAVTSVFEAFADAAGGPAAGLGCLLCNTAVELGASDPTRDGFVQRYFARITESFEGALGRANARGELWADVDPATEARFLTAAVLGIFVLVRAAAPVATVRDAAAGAVAHANRLRRR